MLLCWVSWHRFHVYGEHHFMFGCMSTFMSIVVSCTDMAVLNHRKISCIKKYLRMVDWSKLDHLTFIPGLMYSFKARAYAGTSQGQNYGIKHFLPQFQLLIYSTWLKCDSKIFTIWFFFVSGNFVHADFETVFLFECLLMHQQILFKPKSIASGNVSAYLVEP
jgi:hypothetical protein